MTYYTPPKIIDAACGTGGFLSKGFDLMPEPISPNDTIKEYGDLLAQRAWLDAQLAAKASGVVQAARAPSVPVDVDDLLAKIQTGADVPTAAAAEPVITDDTIATFEGAYVGEARARAATIRQIVATAATIAAGAAKAGIL